MTKHLPPQQDLKKKTTWIQTLSHGGLVEPSAKWKQAIKCFEMSFEDMRGEFIDENPNLAKRLNETLSKPHKHISKEAIRIYSRLRTFIRIRHLNRRDNPTRNNIKTPKKW